MDICRIGGTHYRRTGGDKAPVVLLHGLMTSGECWTPLARMLEKDYDVIMPDARGHGNSYAPPHGYRYEDLANDVLDLIEELDLSKPVLVGHSMGGMTAAVTASLSSKPLGGMVLADPTFLTPAQQQEVYESDVEEQHCQVLKGSKEEFLLKKLQKNTRSRELVEWLVQARFQTSIHAFEVLKPPNPDYKHLVEALTIPTLLVTGDIGAVVSQETASELAQLNSYLEVILLKECGHGIPFDQPENFGNIVLAFLDSLNS